ncbi:MAG: hypothetical protein ACRDRW_09265 [Pseudonocardiaceae bacterium]
MTGAPSGRTYSRLVMMTSLTQHDQPLSGLNCERCRLIFAEGTTISPRYSERVREAVRWSADGGQPSGHYVGDSDPSAT